MCLLACTDPRGSHLRQPLISPKRISHWPLPHTQKVLDKGEWRQGANSGFLQPSGASLILMLVWEFPPLGEILNSQGLSLGLHGVLVTLPSPQIHIRSWLLFSSFALTAENAEGLTMGRFPPHRINHVHILAYVLLIFFSSFFSLKNVFAHSLSQSLLPEHTWHPGTRGV